MNSKKKISGSAYRKIAKEKSDKNDAVLAKTANIKTFFSSSSINLILSLINCILYNITI